MKTKWIGTSWKMNHLRHESLVYASELKSFYTAKNPISSLFLCVPFTVLHLVANNLKGTNIQVSAQNTHWLDRGAVTGEISPLMIKDAGASMVEIGHSERRSMFAETDIMINAKVKAVLQNGLRPLVCIGETTRDKEMDLTFEKLASQMKIAFHEVRPEQADQILVAYEPVWAIGESGSPASPEYADCVHAHIKQVLREIFGQQSGDAIPVLYGGSVNQQNAISLVSRNNIDGLFIGRAAWKVEGFIAIISMVEEFISSGSTVQ